MNDEEFKQILKDPKKILELFVAFHRFIHLYEAEQLKTNPGIEKMGLSDSLDIQVSHSNKSEEVKQ